MDLHGSDLVTIDRFIFLAEAEVARAVLESNGIDAVLADENVVRLAWGDAQAHGGVRLQVRRSDEVDARAVLASERTLPEEAELVPLEDEASVDDELPAELSRCLRCGSDQIFPVKGRAKIFAQSVLGAWVAATLVTIAHCGGMLLGSNPSNLLMAGFYATAASIPVNAVVAPAFGTKRCRACQAEWRGKQRSSSG